MNVVDEILQHNNKKVLFIVGFLVNYYAFVFKLRRFKFRFTAPYIKAINILSAYAILTSIQSSFKNRKLSSYTRR
jgi:hypothetical protein